MKRIYLIGIIVLAAILSACGASKSASSQQSQMEEVEVKESDSEKKAEEKPATRAWGEATHTRLSFAKAYAENMARNEYSRNIKTILTSAIDEGDGSETQSEVDDNSTISVEDQQSLRRLAGRTSAQNIVGSVILVNTDVYKMANGQYHVYVCVEYLGDEKKLAEDMVNSLRKQISDEDNLKLAYKLDKLQEQLEKDLKRMNQPKDQQ